MAKLMRDESIEELVARLDREGYEFNHISYGEATVDTPLGNHYKVSLTGESLPVGCDCAAGDIGIPCKHKRVVIHMARMMERFKMVKRSVLV